MFHMTLNRSMIFGIICVFSLLIGTIPIGVSTGNLIQPSQMGTKRQRIVGKD